MNRLLLLATILLAVVYMVAAVPIPESFHHQHRLEKRCNGHSVAFPKPSALPSAPSNNRRIQPIINNTPSRNINVSENNVGKEEAVKVYLPDTSVEVTEIVLPSATMHGVKRIQAAQATTSSSDDKPTTTVTSEEPAQTTSSSTTTSAAPETTTTAAATTTTIKTTSEKPTTATTTAEKAAQTSSSDEDDNSNSSGGGGGSFPYSGDGTWYNPGLGSCGITNTESDFIAAMNYQQMENGANPNNNPNCGRKVQIKGPSGTVTVTVTDTCPTCAHGSIDLSPIAFEKIASLGDGRVPIHWNWLN